MKPEALCAAMNSRRTKQLRYVFGDASEVLSGETMASWITGSSNGQVTLDQEKVAAFVANLAATYDTAGKTRTFTGVTGAEYQLTGPYGWKMDQAGEITALTELISSGRHGRMVTVQTGSLYTARVQFPEQVVTGAIHMYRWILADSMYTW